MYGAAQKAKLKKEVAELEAENSELEEVNTLLEKEKTALQKEKTALEVQRVVLEVQKAKLRTELAELQDYGRKVFDGDMVASFSEDGYMAWFEPTQKAIDARVAGLAEHHKITEEDGAAPEADSDSPPSTPPARSSGEKEEGTADEPAQTPPSPDEHPDIPSPPASSEEHLAAERPLPHHDLPDVSTPPASPVIGTSAPPAPASPMALTPTVAPLSPAADTVGEPLPAAAGDEVAAADAASKLPSGFRWYAQAAVVMCMVTPPLCAIATGMAVGGVRGWINSKLRR